MPISVLIAGLPRLLTEMLSEAVDRPPEFSLAGITNQSVRAGSAELESAIRTLAPEAAILGMRPHEAAAVESTSREHRDLAIVAVDPNGVEAWNVETRTEFLPLESISPVGIRRALTEIVHAHTPIGEPCRIGDSPSVPERRGT